MKAVFVLLAALVPVLGLADWLRDSVDLQVGAGAAQTATVAAGAGAAVTESIAAGGGARTEHKWTVTSGHGWVARYTNAVSEMVVGAQCGFVGSTNYTNSVSLAAVTSGVSVVLATWTNGANAVWSPTVPLRLPAGTVLTITAASTGLFSTVLHAWTQEVEDWERADFGNMRAIALDASVGPVLPQGATLTLMATTSGVDRVLATFTNGSAAWAASAYDQMLPGDTITVASDGVTNSATVALRWMPGFASAAWGGGYLIGASVGTVAPQGVSATLTATTSGVDVVLAAFTNGAAAWADGPLLITGDDTVTLTAPGVTNRAVVTLTYLPLLSGLVAPLPEGLPMRVVGARVLTDPGIAPAGDAAVVSAALLRVGESASALATWTNGAAEWTPEAAVYLYRGDSMPFTAAGVTNAAAVRVYVDRQE